MAFATDLHQHVWPEAFLAALSARSTGPRAVRRADGAWTLCLDGEPDSVLGEREICLHRRDGALFAAGIERALLVPPLAIGIDALERDEARGLLDGWLSGALDAGPRFGAWAGIAADAPPSDVTAALGRGAVGLALPATRLADAEALDRNGPVLEALERAGRPLFIHPGAVAAPAGRRSASWWPAVADYPGQLQRAWATWLDRGLEQHPSLRVAFAALAGGAPLLLERLAARGGPVGSAADERIVYETSSFGPAAIAGAAAAVGADRIGFGSDRPVVAATGQHVPDVPGLDPAALTRIAAAGLLGAQAVREDEGTVVVPMPVVVSARATGPTPGERSTPGAVPDAGWGAPQAVPADDPGRRASPLVAVEPSPVDEAVAA
ncbi:MAG: amidohydrolase [Solirubrobacteraceae bacterium]